MRGFLINGYFWDVLGIWKEILFGFWPSSFIGEKKPMLEDIRMSKRESMTLIERITDLTVTYPYVYHLMESRGSNPDTTILICGDFFVNTPRGTEDWKCVNDKFDEDTISLIRNADISLVNLEAPTTLSSNRILKSGPALRMNPNVLFNINHIGFNGVTLANNHIMDFGSEGLIDTLSGAKDLGLLTCGAGLNIHEAVQPILIQRPGGLRIAVFSFCEKEFGVSDENTPGSAWISHPAAISEIEKCRDSVDFILVIAHGGLEYLPLPPLERQAQLRQFVDAGADVIVGHHPHVPQGWEKYREGHIFYSTGNLIFDKRGWARRPETEWGFMVQLQFASKNMINIGLILTENKEGTVQLTKNSSSSKNKIAYLNTLSEIMRNPKLYQQYWQELAIRRYYDQYTHLLSSRSISQRFIAAFNRIQRILGRDPIYPCRVHESNKIHTRDLALLNIIRNESHSWAIIRALSIITMQEPDLRCNGTECQVDRLFMQAEGQFNETKSVNPVMTEENNG